MRSLFYKWLFIGSVWIMCASLKPHPFFVSVTEIEHNAKDKTLEISCKIFTDDFEKTLRTAYKTHVDLYNAAEKTAMDKLVKDYVTKHLSISVDGKIQTLQYKGYEHLEEAIYSYYLVENVNTVKKIDIANTILYDYKEEQMSIIHVTVGGKRQSTKLVNPEERTEFSF